MKAIGFEGKDRTDRMSHEALIGRVGCLGTCCQLVLGEHGEERKMEMGQREGARLTGDNEVLENAGNCDDLLQSPLAHWQQTHQDQETAAAVWSDV